MTLHGWLSMLICPFVVFVNRNRAFDVDDFQRLSDGRIGIFMCLVSICAATIPLLLGYRHLWWLGLFMPMVAAETTLGPTKPWDIVDGCDSVRNRLAGKGSES